MRKPDIVLKLEQDHLAPLDLTYPTIKGQSQLEAFNNRHPGFTQVSWPVNWMKSRPELVLDLVANSLRHALNPNDPAHHFHLSKHVNFRFVVENLLEQLELAPEKITLVSQTNPYYSSSTLEYMKSEGGTYTKYILSGPETVNTSHPVPTFVGIADQVIAYLNNNGYHDTAGREKYIRKQMRILAEQRESLLAVLLGLALEVNPERILESFATFDKVSSTNKPSFSRPQDVKLMHALRKVIFYPPETNGGKLVIRRDGRLVDDVQAALDMNPLLSWVHGGSTIWRVGQTIHYSVIPMAVFASRGYYAAQKIREENFAFRNPAAAEFVERQNKFICSTLLTAFYDVQSTLGDHLLDGKFLKIES